MAEYVIQGETLTEIADGIRTMLGTSSPMDPGGMKTNIDTAQDEVDTQADLIAQIKAELASKAAGTTPADPALQSKTVTPSAEDQVVAPDPGYDGLAEVTVQGDGDLVPENIKSGVNIFGVTGTLEAGSGSVSGGAVQMKTGNISIGRSLAATECGFSPDVVIFEAVQNTYGDTVTSGVAWIDDEADKYAIFVGYSLGVVTCHHSIMTVRKNASGFSARAILYDTSGSPVNGTIDQTVKYTAIKYTA